MKENRIQGTNGYEIPIIENCNKDNKKIVLISHGFGSSRTSPTAAGLQEYMQRYGIGTCSYDFPEHGDSLAPIGAFRVKNCIRDMQSVEQWIKEQYPNTEIVYFSSSFGAYINLLYLSLYPNYERKSFLRCAALQMRSIFDTFGSPMQKQKLQENGSIVLDYEYAHPLTVTKEFYNDLKENNVFQKWNEKNAKLAFIHGDADTVAPIQDVQAFVKKYGYPLTVVPDSDHPLRSGTAIDAVHEAALAFYMTK